MKLYENIKKRRQELGLSQQELAERVGYSGKSMISQIESGIVDLPESMIMKFAIALDTTPAYLMGWNDEFPEKIFDESFEKSGQTSRLRYYLDMFSKLSEQSQNSVIEYMDYQLSKENTNNES